MKEFFEAVRPVLASQHGLITSAQVKAIGAHHELPRRLVARGAWERLDTTLFGPTGVAMYWRRRVLAAVLVGPPGALASHRSAAVLLGVGAVSDPPVELSIPRSTSLRRRGLVVHESEDLALAQPRVIDGIPSTGPRRLAVDLGSVVSPARYRHTLREIRHRLGITNEELLRTYLQHRARGRNGGGALRDWLDRYFDVGGVPESGLEQLALDGILDSGLPAPTLQYWVETSTGRYRLDAAYPDRLTAVEVNGSQHRDHDVAANDVVRAASLRALGWQVLEIDSARFASDLTRVIEELHAIHRSVV